VLEFGFFLVTPRLLLDLPFKWRDLVPGAAVCTVAASVVHTVATFFLRNWFGAYGHAYGGFGVSLALAAFVGIIASFWVWIAAVMGVWWERKAGPAAVAAMEELSRPQRVMSARAARQDDDPARAPTTRSRSPIPTIPRCG
jgi:uncharacterized BrkB/YihY/UPF0761 family membrane protein